MKKINFFLSMTPFVMAAEKWSDEKGEKAATLQDITVVIERIFNVAVRLAGVAVFIMLIVGGFQYLTAGGDPKKTQAAGSTITSAIFGLVAVILIWFVLLFIHKFTGVDVTQFNLVKPE